MGRVVIEVPAGIIGDIEAALMRAGLGEVESTKLAAAIISTTAVGFRDDRLVRSGIDVSRLVAELRGVGLVVHWSGTRRPVA